MNIHTRTSGFEMLVRRLSAAILCLVTVFTPIDLAAQRSAPAADEWYLMFSITISGHGRKKPEEGKENTVLDWSIDRGYSGTMRFTRSAKQDFRSKQGFVRYCVRRNETELGELPMSVTIDQRIRIYSEGTYQHDSWENVTVLSHRVANTVVQTDDGSCLDISQAQNKFELDFRLKAKGNEKNGIDRMQTTFERSEYGFGGKPTHEAGPITETPFAVSRLRIPSAAKAFIDGPNDMIYFRGKLPRNYLKEWKVTVGPEPLREPLIADIPETATDVKITLIYQLSKTPF